MEIKRTVIVLDAVDLAASSSFWAGVLGGTVDADDDWHTVVVDGQPYLAIQEAPDHQPPQWPDGAPQQIHLDLYVDDVTTAHEEVVDRGATVLQQQYAATDPEGFWVYADPAGHPFCLCW